MLFVNEKRVETSPEDTPELSRNRRITMQNPSVPPPALQHGFSPYAGSGPWRPKVGGRAAGREKVSPSIFLSIQPPPNQPLTLPKKKFLYVFKGLGEFPGISWEKPLKQLRQALPPRCRRAFNHGLKQGAVRTCNKETRCRQRRKRGAWRPHAGLYGRPCP